MRLGSDGFVVEEGLDQHYEVLKELGDCHTALGHFDRARQCYEEAALLAPDNPGPHVGRGVIGLECGSMDEAERAFREALDADAACAEAWAGLAMVFQQRRQFSDAFEMYMKCLQRDPDNLAALLGLFQASRQMGTFARVIGYLEAYLDRHPGDASVLFCLASLYARDGRLREAEDALQAVLALLPESGDAAALLDEVRRRLAASPAEAHRP
ncbi:MAG: tetratricopeptide repeat protein [Planctomycetes bacterium]|nr:tetratricopeptide repeat protein [Planctomycetota bacterium]